MAEVELLGVNKWFDDFHAVKDVDLHVEDREFMVLLGPSGSGKTTVLRMIAGLEEVSAGDVFIGGRRVTDLQPKAREISMVFQNYALFAHMTVFENIAFGLRQRRAPKEEIERKVDEVARMLGLSDWLRNKPRQLSGGMQQRVALGRAIARASELYLMDEPLSNLDALLRVETRTEIIKLARALEATVVYVTHDQVEAMTMATRMAVMRGGQIQQLGTPLEIYNRPVNRFVAGFIGIPRMTFFEEAQLTTIDGARAVVTSAFTVALPRPLLERLRNDGRGAREVVLGVRPEDVHIADGAEDAVAEGTVDVVEPLGPHNLVIVRTADLSVSLYADAAARVGIGDTVRLSVEAEKLHLFDPQSEESLLA